MDAGSLPPEYYEKGLQFLKDKAREYGVEATFTVMRSGVEIDFKKHGRWKCGNIATAANRLHEFASTDYLRNKMEPPASAMQSSTTPDKSFDALQMLEDACSKHNMRLDMLVAETALWAHPNVHRRQVEKHKSAAVYSHIRRVNVSKGEKRGQVIDGVKLDDNTYANVAIKNALGINRKMLLKFECCHIWPKTCYDTRYHTAVANLVLLPRALAGLTDHNLAIQRAIQYRAFELYGWHPEEQSPPARPANYPENWLEPLADPIASEGSIKMTVRKPPATKAPTSDDPVSFQVIRGWANKPELNAHSIIALALRHNPISRGQLVKEIEELKISKDAYGAVASLMTNRGNNYGRVFVKDETGRLVFHPSIRNEIARHRWMLKS